MTISKKEEEEEAEIPWQRDLSVAVDNEVDGKRARILAIQVYQVGQKSDNPF